MGARRKAREAALQVLYLTEVAATPEKKAWLSQKKALSALDEKSADFARALVLGTRRRLEEVDKAIAEAAENWTLERMAAIDKNLLRLAAYEILHEPGTPPKVVINEAVEIAREYSTEESSRFVNGVLDKIGRAALSKKP